MGLNFSSLYNFFFSKRTVKVLMLGLDNAGKSTILYKLKLNDLIVTIPTIGFNVEVVEYKNLSFTIWDIGGQAKIRPLWKHYYNNNDALIFVIDSNDPDRIEEARDELHSMLSDDQLRDTTVLILANKQDLPCAMKVSEVTEKLGVSNFRNRKWYVQGMSAVKGDGLYEGLDWLAHNLPSR